MVGILAASCALERVIESQMDITGERLGIDQVHMESNKL